MYYINDNTIPRDSPDLQLMLQNSYSSSNRPLCMCTFEGVEMYIAKLDDLYFIKRMPNTGSRHHYNCESFDPPPELSGLGQVLGNAIQEDSKKGETKLRFGFSLTKLEGRNAPAPSDDGEVKPGDVEGNPMKLSLLSTLHYLWEQSGLLKWKQDWSGKRNWYYARKMLQQSLSGKAAKAENISDLIYIPETFFVDRKLDIQKRRSAAISRSVFKGFGQKKLMIVIGELKEIIPSSSGYHLVLKHLSDLPFIISEEVLKKINKKYKEEFNLWVELEGASHMITIATFYIDVTGKAQIESLALMLVNKDYLPIESASEVYLLSLLNNDHRDYIKGMRYNMSKSVPLAAFVLTDTNPKPTALYIQLEEDDSVYGQRLGQLISASSFDSWVWNTTTDVFPPFPQKDIKIKGK